METLRACKILSDLKKPILWSLLLLTYGLFFYLINTLQIKVDFTSFYTSAQAYNTNVNPYGPLIASFLIKPIEINANLNPPFFLQLISPLSTLHYKLALFLWSAGSFISGICGALIAFKMLFSKNDFINYKFYFIFIYLTMFSTLMNTSLCQMGGYLLFFVMVGYYFFQQKQDCLAGFFWGFIIALKIVPGLIFIFVLHQKRYNVFLLMCLTCLFTWLLPLFTKGLSIYSFYFEMLSHVRWYGDNWNASLYGFLYRLFGDWVNPLFITGGWLLLSIFLLYWYINLMTVFKTDSTDQHRAFSLTLAMTLLLNPLSWLYYFSLLIMPITYLWLKKVNGPLSMLWFLCLLFINFPMGYVHSAETGNFFHRVSLYSIYFYGLAILIFYFHCLKNKNTKPLRAYPAKMEHLYPLAMILSFGLIIVLIVILAKAGIHS